MADIKINDIKPAGAELFNDSENLMDDLNDNDLQHVIGGITDVNVTTAKTCTGAYTCASKLQ